MHLGGAEKMHNAVMAGVAHLGLESLDMDVAA
jgi:hypothetical protein